MLSLNILISSKILPNDFLKNRQLKYYVYNSDILFDDSYFSFLKTLDVKVIDTYNNGAITINIGKDDKLSIYSQLKDF